MRRRFLVLSIFGCALAGCQQVPFNQRELTNSRLMQVDAFPSLTHFEQKIFYSREGAAGGVGETAGGGCGCY